MAAKNTHNNWKNYVSNQMTYPESFVQIFEQFEKEAPRLFVSDIGKIHLNAWGTTGSQSRPEKIQITSHHELDRFFEVKNFKHYPQDEPIVDKLYQTHKHACGSERML